MFYLAGSFREAPSSPDKTLLIALEIRANRHMGPLMKGFQV